MKDLPKERIDKCYICEKEGCHVTKTLPKGYLCDECLEKYCYRCDDCGVYWPKEDYLFYRLNNGRTVCEFCVDNHDDDGIIESKKMETPSTPHDKKSKAKAKRAERIKYLERRIYEYAIETDKRKSKRTQRTFFVLCAVIALLPIYFALSEGNLHEMEIEFFLTILLGTPIAAGLIMFVSSMILYYIISGAQEDEKQIAKMIGELNALKLYQSDD